MRLVVKYGGPSISSVKDIQTIAKNIRLLSKKNEVTVVCSAVHGITDDLLEISDLIRNEDKSKAEQVVSKVINKHKQLATKTIKKPNLQKKLLSKLDQDFSELLALIDGIVLLGEVTARSMDYLSSFGERLSMKLISAAINDIGKKSVPLTGKEVGIVTDSVFGESKPLMDTTRLRVLKTI